MLPPHRRPLSAVVVKHKITYDQTMTDDDDDGLTKKRGLQPSVVVGVRDRSSHDELDERETDIERSPQPAAAPGPSPEVPPWCTPRASREAGSTRS